ncbi:hypothetical protein SAY87_016788 [Trapa incisa]|uniref:Epidermal patterning factor-like protein n=1 Tax=Trapa incisa TaxID=236973 RepID=A0AAN7LIA7_9MYRT|nr:hypothetical protein SAY87_016788 [Trapa incisa]
MEEKVRLGSTPPSCYNKCNGCHPCLAVQVPTLPISPSLQADPVDLVDPSHGPSRYSNYKPLDTLIY